MEHGIIGTKRTDRTRNTSLRSIIQVADVGAKTAKLKWEWTGHVNEYIRRDGQRLSLTGHLWEDIAVEVVGAAGGLMI